MSDDHRAQAFLLEAAKRMKPGWHQLFESKLVEAAYPPIGEADQSLVGIWTVFALAFGGHRPERSMTTMDRFSEAISENLGPDFTVIARAELDAYQISRKGLTRQQARCAIEGQRNQIVTALRHVDKRDLDQALMLYVMDPSFDREAICAAEKILSRRRTTDAVA